MAGIIWLLSCILLASCVLGDFIHGPGGRLLNSDCHVELPQGATVKKAEGKIILADGTILPYPECRNPGPVTNTSSRTNQKREVDGWDEYAYYYPSTSISFDQYNGDWVVPNLPGQGYRGQLLYYFTGLEPNSDSPILQPVVWYGISPAGGGSAWYAAVWEVNSDNTFTTTGVVQVQPGQVITATMNRIPGQYWNTNMYANGALISAGNFGDLAYNIAFVTLEVYNVIDCWCFPYATTTNFYNLAIHEYGGGWITVLTWNTVSQIDCGQSVAYGTNNVGLNYGEPALLSPLIFDAGFYAANNADLANFSVPQLQAHWQTYGVYEGRQAVAGFWVSDYKWLYADLAPLANNVAISHYATNGYLEGRVGRIILSPLAFDYIYYVQNYPDLMAAFGYDRNALNDHWCQFGVNEGRQAIATFWSVQYMAMYPDLQAAFGATNYYMGTHHWVTNGYAEGRKGVN